jgi:hypothetical protein
MSAATQTAADSSSSSLSNKWIRSVTWEGKLDGKLVLIDQRKLPTEFTLVWRDLLHMICPHILIYIGDIGNSD